MIDEPTAARGTFAQALRSSAWIVAICIIVLAAAAYVYSTAETKSYTATATVIVQDPALAVTGASSTAQTVGALAATEAARITRREVSRAVAARVGDGLTSTSAAAAVSTYVDPTSNAVEITATGRTGVLAARIANAFAIKDAELTNGAVEQQYAEQAVVIQQKINAVGQPALNDGVHAQLAPTLLRAQQLAHSAPEVQLDQLASPATSPSSPKTARNVAILAVVGLVIGVILADLRRVRARRISAPAPPTA